MATLINLHAKDANKILPNIQLRQPLMTQNDQPYQRAYLTAACLRKSVTT